MLAYVPLRIETDDERQPWGTIAIFATNIVVALVIGCWDPFFGLFKGLGIVNPYALLLPYHRFEPWTWVTSAFMHRDIAHLAFNLAFLLAFGMAVERVLGWRRFLIAYFAIAVMAGAVEQLVVLGEMGWSGGASGCIFGLLAIALVWTPRTKILMGYWVWRHVGTVWVPISVVAWWFLGLNLAVAVLTGFTISSSMLHVLGAGAGLAIALVALRYGWVDLGGEDWFSLRRAERERIAALPVDDDPLRHVVVPQYTMYDHLHSYMSFMLPVVAGLCFAWGLVLIVFTRGDELPKALLLEAVGVGLFVYWQRR